MDCFSQVVARFRPDGAPDRAFGDEGVREFLGTDGYGDGSYGNGLLVRPDGGLLLGYAGRPGPRVRMIAPDGDAAGTETPLAGALALRAELPDGRIVAEGPGRRLVVLRADLTPDPGFRGGAGARVPAVIRDVYGVAGTADAVLVAGTDRRDLLLAILPLDGSRARVLRARIPRPAAGPRWEPTHGKHDDLQVANGRAVVASTWNRGSGTATRWRTAVAAFSLRTKRPIAAFGKGGVAFVAQRYARVALQRDGRVLVVTSGADQMPWRPGRLVVRRLTADGRSDPAFPVRTLATGLQSLIGMDAVLDPRGRLLVAGGALKEYPGTGAVIMRFLTR
jgi:hypothetical protein